MAKRGLALKILIVVAAMLWLLVLAYSDRNTVEGIVTHKTVSGVKDDTSYTILVNYYQDGEQFILLKDEDYEEYFSPRGEDAVVTESLERAMKEVYSPVNYYVNVRVALEEGTRPYRVSREVFNNIEVGTKVGFRWSGAAEIPEIVELLTTSG
ncbi:MAG: hypothetical protein IBX67_02735 [Dehalococcoidia bacterium]|nr:hypothetical protein [Dehalococcoidia bacterium]